MDDKADEEVWESGNETAAPHRQQTAHRPRDCPFRPLCVCLSAVVHLRAMGVHMSTELPLQNRGDGEGPQALQALAVTSSSSVK